MPTDEDASIVKWSEYMLKVKDSFTVLEEGSLIKDVCLPKSFSKVQERWK